LRPMAPLVVPPPSTTAQAGAMRLSLKTATRARPASPQIAYSFELDSVNCTYLPSIDVLSACNPRTVGSSICVQTGDESLPLYTEARIRKGPGDSSNQAAYRFPPWLVI
jgi:hypothetical protein